MLRENRYEMNFERSHVQAPLMCDMAHHFPGIMFNIEALSVGIYEASMRIVLVGETPDLRAAEALFTAQGVQLCPLGSDKFRGQIPNVPVRRAMQRDAVSAYQKKLWLTILGSLKQKAFLWVLARRYDVTFKIMQSTTGPEVSIVSLLVWGPQAEVEGAVTFLREQGINVEYGEVAVSAPFAPIGD